MNYQASPIKRKRKRRTAAEVDELFGAVVRVLNEYKEAITIRHLFYRLEGIGVIAKDEKSYNHLVSHLGKWRINGTIPFNRFVDGTRWHYGVDTFDDAAAAMEEGIRSYRKNLWRDQLHYVEVWCEKEAIASLVKPVADQWGLKTFVCRGFNSLSGSASAADQFLEAMEKGKSPVILYLGDHDPSGLCIDQSLMKHLSYFDIIPKNDLGIQQVTVADRVEFVRVAILPGQIEEFNSLLAQSRRAILAQMAGKGVASRSTLYQESRFANCLKRRSRSTSMRPNGIVYRLSRRLNARHSPKSCTFTVKNWGPWHEPHPRRGKGARLNRRAVAGVWF
jgi:hypothetical protein